MSFLTSFFSKGYKGGPDFSALDTIRIDLDQIRLTLIVPGSKIPRPKGERNSSVPFRSPGWFDIHRRQWVNHSYASIFSELWPYSGVRAYSHMFGVLDVQIAIKQCLPGKVLNRNNLDTLAEAIRWDYEWYFEVAEPGEYGQGGNRAARQMADDEFRCSSLPEEEKRRQKTAYLSEGLFELPTRFEPRRYGDQHWLYYALKQEPADTAHYDHQPRDEYFAAYPVHYYCQPLDELHYLYVRFSFHGDLLDYPHRWLESAEAAEQRIMETVRLDFLHSSDDLGH